VLTLREEPGPFKFKLNAAGEQVIMMGMYIMIPVYAGREPASVRGDRGPGRVTIMAVPLPVDSGIKIIIAWRDQCRCRHWQCGGALAEGPSSETPSLATGKCWPAVGASFKLRPSGPRAPRLLVLYY
jgi:hypothetical protein